MITLTGQNTLRLPEVSQFGFTFNPLFVQTSGVSTIGFTNTSGVTGFSLWLSGQNIYLKSSGVNKKISSYNLNEAIVFSGNCLNGTGSYNYLDFYINDIHINSWQELISGNIGLLNINVASGDTMQIDLGLFSGPINWGLSLPTSYAAFGQTTGVISTNTNFWILNSNTTFSNSYQPLLSVDTIIAPVKINIPLNLTLVDFDDSSQDYTVDIVSYLNSNIGDLTFGGSINRTGNNESNLLTFRNLSSSNNISGLFDGSWNGNNFIYNDAPEMCVLNYEYSNIDTNGNQDINQTILIKYEADFPLSGQSYTSEYITGFDLTNGGQYSSQPSVIFNNYYYTTGISQLYSSLLFSSGCTGNLPVTFTGGGGSGASGYLLLAPATVANLYGAGNINYHIVTGGVFNNIGTNYSFSPTGVVLTGAYGNTCYDVPKFYNSNLYSFSKFDSIGLITSQATALTGLVLGITGLIGVDTGYFVTGLDITNIGYGYNASRMPSCTFIRPFGDSYSVDASGAFLMKSTGNYNMGSVWTVSTGWTNGDLVPLVSGLSGVISSQNQYFTIQLQCSGLDNTSGVINKLSVLPSLGSGIVQCITGTKYFSSDPYFLKKKLNSGLVVIISGDLSFLTTQTELDTIYADYTSNQVLDMGDLSF
jgi:hypothetical protein